MLAMCMFGLSWPANHHPSISYGSHTYPSLNAGHVVEEFMSILGTEQTLAAIISNIYHVTKDLLRSGTGMTAEGGEELDFSPNGVFFLGASYDDVSSTELLDDLKSRIWITYRHSFPPIQPSTFTTDVGWGCMLRSGQMLLANSFIVDRLGRDWRISKNTSPQMWSAYIEIVSWFLDSNSSPYSIHRIALLGKQFEKEIGQWFGPTTISQVLKVLVNNEASSSLSIYVGNDGVLYTDEIRKELDRPLDRSDEPGGSTFVNGAANRRSVLILMPLRLGVDNLNPIYYNGLKQCLAISNCVGIAGGRPNSSLFFVGVHGENLLYLDPHYSRPAVPVRDIASYDPHDFASFHCHTVRSVPLSSIDPSLVIGFYIRDIFDLDRFCSLAGSITRGRSPLFSVQAKMPVWSEVEVDLSDEDENDLV